MACRITATCPTLRAIDLFCAIRTITNSSLNIAIGCADGRIGKKMVHAAPDNEDYESWLKGEPFKENMVESAKATIDHFGKRIVYIELVRKTGISEKA